MRCSNLAEEESGKNCGRQLHGKKMRTKEELKMEEKWKKSGEILDGDQTRGWRKAWRKGWKTSDEDGETVWQQSEEWLGGGHGEGDGKTPQLSEREEDEGGASLTANEKLHRTAEMNEGQNEDNAGADEQLAKEAACKQMCAKRKVDSANSEQKRDEFREVVDQAAQMGCQCDE
uniref:Uncharacterized protein n=1 Tax=Globodera pallida TaxID=36090 RepID=A0A183BHV1_GLOPA